LDQSEVISGTEFVFEKRNEVSIKLYSYQTTGGFQEGSRE
jgi:hypothetical protein